MKVLSVRELRKSFRKDWFSKPVEVVKGINFEIDSGTITGFLGANGAGKTTTIKCLLELIYPDSGEINYFGSQRLSPEIRRKIGFLPERPYFYEYLTGYEFLKFYGELSRKFISHELDQRIDFLLNRVRLAQAKKKQLRGYSKGMLQRLGIAQALIHDPSFIILDEPMGGLDPDGRVEVNEIIRETASHGTAVFFSSHLLNDAERICQKIVVLKDGNLKYSGTTEGFISQGGVKVHLRFRQGDQLFDHWLQDPDEKELQIKIDEIRKKGQDIFEIRREGQTLEEVFVKTAIHG